MFKQTGRNAKYRGLHVLLKAAQRVSASLSVAGPHRLRLLCDTAAEADPELRHADSAAAWDGCSNFGLGGKSNLAMPDWVSSRVSQATASFLTWKSWCEKLSGSDPQLTNSCAVPNTKTPTQAEAEVCFSFRNSTHGVGVLSKESLRAAPFAWKTRIKSDRYCGLCHSTVPVIMLRQSNSGLRPECNKADYR